MFLLSLLNPIFNMAIKMEGTLINVLNIELEAFSLAKYVSTKFAQSQIQHGHQNGRHFHQSIG